MRNPLPQTGTDCNYRSLVSYLWSVTNCASGDWGNSKFQALGIYFLWHCGPRPHHSKLPVNGVARFLPTSSGIPRVRAHKQAAVVPQPSPCRPLLEALLDVLPSWASDSSEVARWHIRHSSWHHSYDSRPTVTLSTLASWASVRSFPGADGRVRVANIKVGVKTYIRPVARLIQLPNIPE